MPKTPKLTTKNGVSLPKINQIDIVVPSKNDPGTIMVRNSMTVSPRREREGIINIREPVRRSNVAGMQQSMTSSDQDSIKHSADKISPSLQADNSKVAVNVKTFDMKYGRLNDSSLSNNR